MRISSVLLATAILPFFFDTGGCNSIVLQQQDDDDNHSLRIVSDLNTIVDRMNISLFSKCELLGVTAKSFVAGL